MTYSSGRRTRSKSPVGVPASLLCKVNSQYVRLKKIEGIVKYVSEKKDTVHMNNLVAWRKDYEETYALYEKEHALIEDAYPASFVTNPYFEADFHTTFHEQYHAILFDLSTLEQVWYTQYQATQYLNTDETQPLQSSKLPEIKLPMFNGAYAEWPAYKGRFTGLILKRAGLQDYAKLHYFQSSLTGAPLTLIE